jgi:hypothetical protein
MRKAKASVSVGVPLDRQREVELAPHTGLCILHADHLQGPETQSRENEANGNVS